MSFRWSRRRLALACASLCLSLQTRLPAQDVDSLLPPAADYLSRYRALLTLRPQRDQTASVHHLVLRRGAGILTLEQGTLCLLSPIAGATVGAVFRGQGRFAFAPPNLTERGALLKYVGKEVLDDPITEVVMLFSDSTLEVLRTLSIGPGTPPDDATRHVAELLGSLKGNRVGAFDPEVLVPFLNGERSGFFLAKVTRGAGDPLLFVIDPGETQEVQLYRPIRRGGNWTLVTEFDPPSPRPGSDNAWIERHRLNVSHYRIEVTMNPTGMSADLSFAATASMTLTALEPIGPWLHFRLDPRLELDSARWQNDAAVVAYKAKDVGALWVRGPHRLVAGDSLYLTVFYHGNLIDRFDDWFFINPLADWFPVNGQGSSLATFDLTFHSPSWYPIATIGERTDSTVTGKVMTTHWVANRPTEHASFNLGLFETFRVAQPDGPTVDVLTSEDAHRTLTRQRHVMRESHMPEKVAADVANSLRYFSDVFGPPPSNHFFVTEIPYDEGVSFPGLIHLGWVTFQFADLDGVDQWFRAHEVAHQWWGNGVQNGSYRDKWLSEGLASFSALWYLQHEGKHDDAYFRFLDHYKTDIADVHEEAGPIWLGYRNVNPDVPEAYQVTVYEKGAWVFHMLRMLMLDLSTTKEDQFTETLKDYYNTYKDKPGTTDGFKGVVEKHAGIPMDWFFDEWVKGTGIPTYHVAWKSEPAENGRFRIRLRVSQEHVPADFLMPVLVSADLGQNRTARFRVMVKGPHGEYVSPLLPAEAQSIKFNDYDSVLGDVKMEKW